MDSVRSDSSPAKLPDAAIRLMELRKQADEQRADQFSALVAKKRDDAVIARRTSGIERIWKEDQEYYEGVDGSNAGDYNKSRSVNGGLTSVREDDTQGRCTAFFNITRQFVDSAAARMGDILLPAGDWNFSIKPTPISDINKIKDSMQQVVGQDGQGINNPDGTPHTLGQFADKEQKEAEEKVEKAENHIKDYLTECNYHVEARKAIEDAARVGTGILAMRPILVKSKAVIDGKFVVIEKYVPGSKAVSVEDLFPDGNCGDNIHDGEFLIERDFLSARQLRGLAHAPGYRSKAIAKVLLEGPNKNNIGTNEQTRDDDRFEIWYYHGDIDVDDLDACGCNRDKDDESILKSTPAVLVLVNDTIIKAYLNPLTSSEFPYDLMAWQRVKGSPFGIGVARQGRVAQDGLNAAARTLMQNAGLSSAPQLVFRQGVITPVDGSMDLYGGKQWVCDESADVNSVKDAFIAINIPSYQGELLNLIQYFNKLMEDSTGVSFLLQGQQGSAPDTVGGMQILHKNASALLRRIARVFDESITEPHIRRYYDWILIHGEDDEKGDLEIQAVGSSALVEREIQAMQAQQILTLSLNPAFGLSPAKAAEEVLRAWRFEPSKFTLSEDEKKQASQVQPQPAPAIEAAKIRAASSEKIAQSNAQMRVAIDKNDLDRDTLHQQAVTERDRSDHEARMQEMNLRRELAMLDYSNKHQISLEKVKAELAGTAMKLRATKELAGVKAPAKDLPTPIIEPAGRAENGMSYQQ